MSIGENRLACQEKIWGIKNIDLDKFLLHDKFHVRGHQSCIVIVHGSKLKVQGSRVKTRRR